MTPALAAAGDTFLVSTDASGAAGNDSSGNGIATTTDGRQVAFGSDASNLIPDDTNGTADVFIKDVSGTVERASVSSLEEQANGFSIHPSMSGDGRHVLFLSAASNLVAGDTNGTWDLFVRDRTAGTTERVSLTTEEGELDAHVQAFTLASMSRDARYVVFNTAASNLAGATPGVQHVYLRDRVAGTTELVSTGASGAADASSWVGQVSNDGRYVSFGSGATNLHPSATNGAQHAYVRDRQAGATELVDVMHNGDPTSGTSPFVPMDASGRYVAFSAFDAATADDTNGLMDLFVRDRMLGATERVSVRSDGTEMTGGFGVGNYPRISDDGNVVAFNSYDTDLVPGDVNGNWDVFVHVRSTGETSMASSSSSGEPGNSASDLGVPSGDGSVVFFNSNASNLVASDLNGEITDVFVREVLTPVPPDSVSEDVGPGTEVSTGGAPTASDPVETSVTPSAGGTVSITENTSVTTTPPSGYSLLGTEVVISAPPGSATEPLVLRFRLLFSLLSDEGLDENSLQILRNGVVLPSCDPVPPRAAGTVSPEPACVETRAHIDDYAELTILTVAASTWNFGVHDPFDFSGFSSPLKPFPAYSTFDGGKVLPVKFGLGGNEGMNVFAAGYPRSVQIACSGAPAATGGTSTSGTLAYTARTQRYTYSWVTQSAWIGTCRQLIVQFIDGSVARANVRFAR